MRRSVDNMDGTIWDVWLDGVLQENVVMADDETGEVERFKLDEHGAFRIAGDALETETVRGKVEIRPAGARITKLQGLVAPVWSDAGTVPVGEVTYTGFEMPANIASAIPVGEWVTVSLTYKDGAASWSIDFPPCDTVLGVVTIEPNSVRLPDPNAKPSLPALTRVSGNKRGPGWCDEGA